MSREKFGWMKSEMPVRFGLGDFQLMEISVG